MWIKKHFDVEKKLSKLISILGLGIESGINYFKSKSDTER